MKMENFMKEHLEKINLMDLENISIARINIMKESLEKGRNTEKDFYMIRKEIRSLKDIGRMERQQVQE